MRIGAYIVQTCKVCFYFFRLMFHVVFSEQKTKKMKIKEINRTANLAWSPKQQYPIYLVAGTAAQQLDATFR